MLKLSASILSADFLKLGEDIARMEQGGCDVLHIDITDGHFVPNLTMGICVAEAACQDGTTASAEVRLPRGGTGKALASRVRLGEDDARQATIILVRDITVEKGGSVVSGKSIMALMTLEAVCGSKLRVIAAGPDAELVLDELQALVARKFDIPDEQ